MVVVFNLQDDERILRSYISVDQSADRAEKQTERSSERSAKTMKIKTGINHNQNLTDNLPHILIPQKSTAVH